MSASRNLRNNFSQYFIIMRLFIAINLPDAIRKYLQSTQTDLLRAVSDSAELTPARDFHMTLKFLGECGPAKLPQIELEMETVRFEKFELCLKKIGTFGGGRDGTGKPSVVWVGVRMSKIARNLVAEIEKRMFRLGFKKDKRFVPHLTLARVQNVKNQEKFSETLGLIKIKPHTFSVSQFCLFESKLLSDGAKHTMLRKFP